MRRLIFNKNQWYINIVIFIILGLSILSWVQWTILMGGKLFCQVTDETEVESFPMVDKDDTTEISNLYSDEQVVSKNISMVCNLVDTAIDKVDMFWPVYKKEELSKIDSFITFHVTGEISSAQVIGGNEKWLFYKTEVDGNTIADYEGTNRYTHQEMEEIAQVVLMAQDEIERYGVKFAIMVAPNKENIYWEYMPEAYVHDEVSSTDVLIGYLKERGVNIISPKNKLLDEHSNLQLYYYYDTHWNQLGAYIGTREVLSSWNIIVPEISNRKIISKEYGSEGDLAKMVGLSSVFSDEIEYEIEGCASMDLATFEAEQNAGEIAHFHNEEAKNKARILLVGDSFRTSMVPFLREQFVDVYVVYRRYYTSDMMKDINPDYLIAEYVERYSRDMRSMDTLFK